MKNILTGLTLAAIVVFASVQHVKAQAAETFTFNVLGGVTSNLANQAAQAIDVSNMKNVAIKWTVNLTGAGTEVMGIRFQPSVDGTLPSTPAVLGYQMAIAANGATPVIVQTNFDVVGYRYLIPYYMTNGNATLTATNTLKWNNLLKPKSP